MSAPLTREESLEVGTILDTREVFETLDGGRMEWRLLVVDDEGGEEWAPFEIGADGVETMPLWMPLPGSQLCFLQCPVFECLFHGTRGPGKTETLLMDFAKDVGRGFGSSWRGILFRREYKDLDDVVKKCKALFRDSGMFPGAKFLESKSEYKVVFPEGEELLLRHLADAKDYDNYHGHEYPWLGFEELTQWEDDKAYKRMQSCCRSSRPGIFCRVRATTNPYGTGHNWVKKRFELPEMDGAIIRKPGEMPRVAIRGHLSENFILLHAAPNYPITIKNAASNEAEADAWLNGSWNVTAGGMIDDLWRTSTHVIPNIPASMIPSSWIITRAYDHGQSHPFAVGWWLESSGESILVPDGFDEAGNITHREVGRVRGDLILWMEWYGCKKDQDNVGVRMSAGDIAEGIFDREKDEGADGRVQMGPADTEIWTKDNRGTRLSPADDMESKGLYWDRADKSQGSRKRGWERLREYLRGSFSDANGFRENPGLFVCQRCRYWLDLVPSMPRDQEKDLDDVPKTYEDHLADMCFTADTEVLTDRGWVAWPEAREDDLFATVNPETEFLEYQEASEMVRVPWDGDVVVLDNKTRLRVTPNHWMAVRTRPNGYEDLTLKQARDLTIWDKIVCAPKGWIGEDTLGLPFDCDAGDLAELLGWWVADGWLRGLTERSPYQRDVGIAQYKEGGRRKLEALLSRTPWRWSYHNGSYVTTNKALYELLRPGYTDAGDKHILDCVKWASSYLIGRFVDGYISGDGWLRKNGTRVSATVSRTLADDLQELYVKLGRSSSQRVRPAVSPYSIRGRNGEIISGTNTRDQFWVEEWATTTATLRDSRNNANFRTERYAGMVYCAQVPNGTLVVRRQGRVSVTGNTRYRVSWELPGMWRRGF